jgi:hypothetical protein
MLQLSDDFSKITRWQLEPFSLSLIAADNWIIKASANDLRYTLSFRKSDII